MSKKIHHTRGIYPDLSYKDNGVPEANLADHTDYNLTMRPGRAFFVDGKCVYKGNLTPEQIKKVEDDLAAKPVVFDRDTRPYI